MLTTPPSPSDAPMAFAALDRFVPPSAHADGRVAVLRARFLVIASLGMVACSVVFSALFLATGVAGWVAVAPILAMGALCATFPFLLRAEVAPNALAAAFVGLVQCGLIASVTADRGLSDPGVMWLAMTPLMAAFAGGTRLAWGSAVSAAVLVLALLTLERTGLLTSYADPGYDLVVVVNALGCIAVVAALAVLYEGPVVRHFRHLSRRLSETNGELRRELAERKRAQDAAERDRARAEAASRAKDALLANMSHEFRTPLTAILGFTNILSDEVSSEHRPYLASIDRGAHRLLGTLDGVLGLAWIESGGTGLDLTRADVRRETLGVVESLRPLAEARGLTIRSLGPSAHAVVDTDALRRVLHAVVDNAVRFTVTGGVTVEVSQTGDQVGVTVTDTGIGMTEDFATTAFEPFQQASQGHERTHEGVGVGLTMAHRLVEIMGGEIEVESTPGAGTTVRMRFPAAQPVAPHSAWVSRPAPVGRPAEAVERA